MSFPPTAPELAVVRSKKQAARIRAAIINPAVVLAARINQTFATHDSVVELTFDGVTSGAYTDVKPGQSVWIGSAAGLDDLGQARVRAAATATKLLIGETSEIAWADELHLTVVNDFGLWAKPLKINPNGTANMDWEVAYSDQHTNCSPMVVMGSDRVGRLVTALTITFAFDAGSSWVPDSTIAGYAWSFPGASSTTGLTTATPTATYFTPGTYVYSCTVTAANGKSATGYRYAFIDPGDAASQVTVNDCSVNYRRGGVEFSLTLRNGAERSLVRDRAKVILFAEDYYDGILRSLGPLAGSENILAIGWIDGESLRPGLEGGSVEFTVKSAHEFLNRENSFPLGLRNTTAIPAAWTEVKDLTIDKGIAHYATWRSTAAAVMDVFPNGDTRLAPALIAPDGPLWQQLTAIAVQTILAQPCVDFYGRLFCEVDAQFEPNRSGIPTVMSLTKADLTRIDFERIIVPPVSRVELSGVSVSGEYETTRAFFSLAPGHVYKRFGNPEPVDRLLLASQEQANTLAGLILAQRNNQYPRLDFDLNQNNRLIGVCPRQYLSLSLAAEDTPRGIAFSGRILPREISYNFKGGSITVGIVAEAETVADLNMTGDTPANDEIGLPEFPPPPTVTFPPLPPYEPFTFPTIDSAKYLFLVAGGKFYYCKDLTVASPVFYNGSISSGGPMTGLTDMDVDCTGRVFLCNGFNGSIWNGMFDQTKLEIAKYSQLFPNFVNGLYNPQGFYTIWAIGANALVPNQWVAAIGVGYPTNLNFFFSGGLTANKMAPIVPGVDIAGSLTYGPDSFYFSYGIALWQSAELVRYNLATNTIEYGYNAGGAYPRVFHSKAGRNEDVIILENGSKYITNAGTTQIDLGATLDGNRTLPQASGAAPGGLALLVQDTAGIKKSTNGGASWSTVTMPRVAMAKTAVILNLGTTDKWIVQLRDNGGSQLVYLYYTADFGDNWVEISGNYREVVGNTSARRLRYL